MAKTKGEADPSAKKEDEASQDEDLELDISGGPDVEEGDDVEADESEAEDDDPLDDLPAAKAAAAQPAATDPRLIQAIQMLAEGNAQTAAQVAQLNSDRLDIADQQLDSQISNLMAQRQAAMEGGDYAAFNQLDNALSEARGNKQQVAQMRRAMKAAPAKPAKVDLPSAEPPAQQPNQAPQARAWIAKNPWFNDAGGDDASDVAIQISQSLLKRGIGANDPRHYEEIDKRMSKLYPQHYKGQSQRRPAAASGARRPTAEAAPNPNRVQATRQQIRNFELAGFDVNDPKVKQQMAKAIRETQQQHTIRAGGR